jgi:peptide deformylase
MQIFVNPYHTLHAPSTPVDLSQDIAGYNDLEKFEREMINLMIASKGIGLAANQVGITKRFFVIGYESFDVFQKPVILWNPSIVRSSEEIVEDVEGCLSFPGIWVKVKRPKQVTVRWQNMKGETLMQHLDGIESKCFQHELDHIDGVTFDKRVSKLKWDMAKKKATR